MTGLAHDEDWEGPERIDEAQYLTIWRRGGVGSLYLELGKGAHIEQVFPDPSKPEHAPNAKPWTVEWVDRDGAHPRSPPTKEPSARIFAITYPQSSANGRADSRVAGDAGHDIKGGNLRN